MNSGTDKTNSHNGGADGEHGPVIRRAFRELTGKQGWRRVIFSTAGKSGRIEVAFNDQCFRLQVRHGERKGLAVKLRELGSPLPENWIVSNDRPQTLISSGSLDLIVMAGEKATVEAWVGEVGRNVLDWTAAKKISDRLER